MIDILLGVGLAIFLCLWLPCLIKHFIDKEWSKMSRDRDDFMEQWKRESRRGDALATECNKRIGEITAELRADLLKRVFQVEDIDVRKKIALTLCDVIREKDTALLETVRNRVGEILQGQERRNSGAERKSV